MGEIEIVSNRILNERYKLIKPLGRGSFGKTYLAEDLLRTGKPKCVVKKLQPTVTKNNILKVASRLFQTETATLQKLGNHDRIPQLIDSFEQENKFYLVQQYIKGNTLQQELNSQKIWSEAKVIQLLQEILNIIQYIHDRGVIHRDIKPANLIRRQEDSCIVLVDFGSVKEVILAQTQVIASSTVAIGTKGYMPTEQARGKPRFSSDIYALGIIAIQALTGVHPMEFEEEENGEIIWQHQANVSPQLAKIVSSMTRYHCKDRYRSAREVLLALKSLDPHSVLTSTNKNFARSTSSPSLPTVNSTITPPNSFLKKFQFPRSIVAMTLLGFVATSCTYLLQNLDRRNPSEKILNRIELEYQTEKYDLCLRDASSKETELAGVSPQKIDELLALCRLGLAKVAAKNSDFKQALQIAREIPEDNIYYDLALPKIDLWSQQLLFEMTSMYGERGQLEEIIAIVSLIPDTTPVKQQANARLKKWQQEIKIAQNLLANAQQAIAAQQWQVAQTLAGEVKEISHSRYWNERADLIILQAQNQLEIAESNNSELLKSINSCLPGLNCGKIK